MNTTTPAHGLPLPPEDPRVAKYQREKMLKRFATFFRVDPRTGCWNWLGAVQTKGYGSFGAGKKGKSVLAHRAGYELYTKKKIPPGHELKQKCGNKLCVNFAHMVCASRRDIRRLSGSPFGINARKTECKWGHLLEGENVITRADGRRRCRKCDYARTRLYERRKAAKARAERGLAPAVSIERALAKTEAERAAIDTRVARVEALRKAHATYQREKYQKRTHPETRRDHLLPS